jgi:hypothetical protein
MLTDTEFHSVTEWNLAQIPEILSDENKWYTGEHVGHPPTIEECIEHYSEHGGAAYFAKTHRQAWLGK